MCHQIFFWGLKNLKKLICGCHNPHRHNSHYNHGDWERIISVITKMGKMKKRICQNPQKVADIIHIKMGIFRTWSLQQMVIQHNPHNCNGHQIMYRMKRLEEIRFWMPWHAPRSLCLSESQWPFESLYDIILPSSHFLCDMKVLKKKDFTDHRSKTFGRVTI